MNKDKILGIVRHVLTFAGGYLVAKGIVSESALPEAISGLLTIVGIVWSVFDKNDRQQPAQ